MKTITIELSEKQACLLGRVARAEYRRLSDLARLLLADGLESFFCERGVCIPMTPDEVPPEIAKQVAKNEKLEKTKGWGRLSYEEKKARGWERVYTRMANYGDDTDFICELAHSIRFEATKEGETS